MGGSSPTRLLLPRPLAIAISGCVCCCLLLFPFSASFGPITASAKSDVSPEELRGFYDEILNETYAGQDPASMPPLVRSALAKYSRRNRAREALKTATIGVSGAAAAFMGLVPAFRYWGKKRAEVLAATPETSPVPDIVRDYKLAANMETNGDSRANWGNRLYLASGVAAAALLLSLVGVGISSNLTNKKINEDRRKFRRILAQLRRRADGPGDGTSGERSDVASPADVNPQLAGLCPELVDAADKVVAAVEAGDTLPKENSASGGSPTSGDGEAKGAGGSAKTGKGGSGGLLIGLGGNQGVDLQREASNLSQEVSHLLELSKQLGRPAVFHPR